MKHNDIPAPPNPRDCADPGGTMEEAKSVPSTSKPSNSRTATEER